MRWDPGTYQKFAEERLAPFEDLLGLLKLRSHLRVVDLGCGTGVLTKRLFRYLPESRVLGIDSSPKMLETAREEVLPGLEFRQQRIEDFSESCDVIFSNAALHWVPDHPNLLERLWRLLSSGGQLVVQVPCNGEHPSQKILRNLAQTTPFREALGKGIPASPVLPLRDYAEILFSLGGREIVAFDKIYPHILEDAEAMLQWLQGTTLLPYLERLGEELEKSFLQAYRLGLHQAFPSGPIFFGFQRRVFSALRS